MSVIIFANGQLDELSWIDPILSQASAIIAADGGVHHVINLNLFPDVVIGDMDSIGQDIQILLKAAGVPMLVHPPEKDETDLELALLYAVERYEDDIIIVGALGGRLDQTLGNILLLTHDNLAGRRVEIREPGQRAWLVRSETVIEGRVGDTVSLVPLGGDVKIRATIGLHWPLTNERLSVGPSRGISNILTESEARIFVESGHLLCIHQDGATSENNKVSESGA
jgi:thiamine pyrophosphokinase